MTKEPKIWRDMTPEEKGALLLAEHEGKVIEVFGVYYPDMWHENYRCFEDDTAYRIKPEPKRETVVLYGGEQCLWDFYGRAAGVMHKTHKITFDTIDGKPDPASIKIEEL